MPSPVGEVRHRNINSALKCRAARSSPSMSLNLRRLLLQRRLCRLLLKRETTKRRDVAIRRRFAVLQRKRRLLESDSDDSMTSQPRYPISYTGIRKTTPASSVRLNADFRVVASTDDRTDMPIPTTVDNSWASGPEATVPWNTAVLPRLRNISSKCSAGMFTVTTPWGVANTRPSHFNVCKRLADVATVRENPRARGWVSKRPANMSVAARRSRETVANRFVYASCSTPKESSHPAEPNNSLGNSFGNSSPQPLGNFTRTKPVRRRARRSKTEANVKLDAIKFTGRGRPKTVVTNGLKCTWC
ncbi:hypothetical protein LSAT2_026195 [Lamellibrachia satsuma]|nr:hypothetical protein LSAT2_026195 [Lamellibrachia satsuma]